LKEIKLPVFTPRWYQIPPMEALDSGIRNVLLIFGRRSGKDVFAINYMAKEMARHVGVYFYILPSYAQGKKVIWDSITNDGFKMLDYIPPELRAHTNSQEMKIILRNGSVFQIIGSQNYDSLMGTNPRMVVFSEFALQEKKAYEYIQPILAANPKAVQIIVSTPRGHNHFYELYMYAKTSKLWYCDLKTSIETGVVSEEFIEREKERGVEIDHIRQEYYCDFSRGISGSYYGREIDKLELEERIMFVPYEQDMPVHVTFDLGMNDFTAIIFWQVCGREIRYIDYYQNHNRGLEYYAIKMRDKPYIYGDIWFPHDGKVRELGSGISRAKRFEDLMGMTVNIVPDVGLLTGIEYGRKLFHRLFIDEQHCAKPKDKVNGIEKDCLLDCLRNYQKEWDDKREEYKDFPRKSKWNHGADTHRYVAIVVEKDLMTSNNDSSVSEIVELNRLHRKRNI